MAGARGGLKTEGTSIKSWITLIAAGSAGSPLWIAQDGDLYSLPAAGGDLERSGMIGRRPGH